MNSSSQGFPRLTAHGAKMSQRDLKQPACSYIHWAATRGGHSQLVATHQQEQGASAKVLEGTHLVFGCTAAVIGLLWSASSTLAEARTTAGPEDNPSVSTSQLAPLCPCTHMAVLTGGFSIHLGYITEGHSTETTAGVSSTSSINVECQWHSWAIDKMTDRFHFLWLGIRQLKAHDGCFSCGMVRNGDCWGQWQVKTEELPSWHWTWPLQKESNWIHKSADGYRFIVAHSFMALYFRTWKEGVMAILTLRVGFDSGQHAHAS